MTAPRHLWTGDWRRESAEAALARRRAPTEEPPTAPRPSPSKPSRAARALAHLRTLRPSATVLLVLAVLLSAGVGYAAVSLVGSGGGNPLTTGNAPIASPPAHTAAATRLGVYTTNLSPANGVLVVNVVPGSPADQAGLQPGDVITQIGSRPVQAVTDLDSALAGMHAGQQVEIQFDRGPTSYIAQARLPARRANGP